jgi:CHAT domain-containing protein/cytochrome c-type biogenesis protein CcmH/NrfG
VGGFCGRGESEVMNHEGNDEERLRKYLLDELNEAEQQAIEERLLTEQELFDLLSVIEDELIEDYLSGELSTDERGDFESYFLATPDRRRKLDFTRTLARYLMMDQEEAIKSPALRVAIRSTAGWWRRAFFLPYGRVALASLLLLAAALGIWRVYFWRSNLDIAVAMLTRAYDRERPNEGRLTAFKYAPFQNTRGTEQDTADELELRRAELMLLEELSKNPGAGVNHALGQLYLARGEIDKAIGALESALKDDASNAEIHSDLGLALLEQGKRDRSANDSGRGIAAFDMSLNHLNKAIELNGSLLAPRFNRALLHMEMSLPEQAEQDWRLYLDKDSTSKWADDARRHLQALEKEKTRRSRSNEQTYRDFLHAWKTGTDDQAWEILVNTRDAPSGMMIWERLADEYLGESNDAAHSAWTLNALSFVGRLESQRTGDLFTAQLAAFYESSPSKLARIAQGRRLMKRGRQLLIDGSPQEAIGPFYESQKVFSAIGDQWEADYATQWVGYSYLQASTTGRAVAVLEPLLQPLELKNHRWLLMRVLYVLSGAEYNLGDYSKSIEHNIRSLALAQDLDDRIGTFNALSILVEQYRYIGNLEQSLSCIDRSLSLLNSWGLTPIQIAQHHAIVSAALLSANCVPAAIDYQREALARALEVGRPRLTSIAYSRLGQIYGRIGNYGAALENAMLSYDVAQSIADESVRKTMMALASVAIGDLYREMKEYDNALDRYNHALQLYAALDFKYGVLEVHRDRLLCCLARQDYSSARDELNTTLDLIENYRHTILEADNRNNFFDNVQSIYDLATGFAFSVMNDPEKAFDYAEQSRARTLLDDLAQNKSFARPAADSASGLSLPQKPFAVAELLERLPKDAQLVQYAVLNDRILIWVLSTQGLSYRVSDTPQDLLENLVSGYLQALDRGDTGTEQIDYYARGLFDRLFGPIEPLLDKSKLLCIVPDNILNHLPFGALRSSETGRFVVQDYVSIMSPSATSFVICSEIAANKGDGEERILSVGNPRFDRKRFESERDLPSAAREAREVASFYSSRCLLTGDDAKESRVRAEMQRAGVIHLAVHSLVNERAPLKSRLLLSMEPGAAIGNQATDGVLESQEVFSLNLNRARVVLLSACQTGVARYYKGEGMISFARPFLSKGVPLVVVSLWPVDSDATEELMSSLHRYRKRDGISTAQALAIAQREMLQKTGNRFDQPRYWAPFVVIGGSASF